MGVKLEKLSLETLGVVDPRIEAMFQKHIRNIVDDVLNRPGDAGERKLILEFSVRPQVEVNPETGEATCDEIKLSLVGKSKVPTHQTRAFPMKLIKGQGLAFNREIPEDLHQPSLYPDTADEDE